MAVEYSGEGAFFRTATEAFDLILLVLALPGRNGLEIHTPRGVGFMLSDKQP